MLKDLLFPKMCLVCNHAGTYICLKCEIKLVPVKNDSCLYCGNTSYLGLTHEFCKQKNGVDGLLSVFVYNPTLKAIIRNLKYRGVYDAFHELFFSIREPAIIKFYKLRRKNPAAFLQPIPLHKEKLLKRGFNQSVYIANFFRHITTYKVIDVLVRSKNTSAQAQTKDRVSRVLNIKDAFSLRRNVSIDKKNIILVDDVVTTGSTVKEAATILKRVGAHKIFVFSLGRD